MQWLLDWLVNAMATIGAPGVGLATLLETVFPPVPSEVILPLAGLTAQQGHYSVVAAIVWATIGSVGGALLLYYVARAWGYDRLAAFVDRIPLMSSADIERAMHWFNRHGRRAIFFGRLVPGVRSLVSIPAGIDRMPLWQYVTYTFAGSALWNSLLIVAGYQLGDQWHLVEQVVGSASNVLYVLIAAAVVVFVARRLRRRTQLRAG